MKLVNILKEIKVSSPISSGKLKIDHRYRHLSSLSYIRAKDNPGLKLEDKSVDIFSNYVKVYFANSILGGGESYRSDFETFVNYLKRKGIKFTDREETTLLGNHQYWVDIPKSQIEFYNPENAVDEIKVNNPNTKEKQLHAKILSMYPEAKLHLKTWLGDGYSVIYLFSNSGPQSINVNSIIIDPQGVYTAHLGNDVAGRRFKIVDNLIKYIKNNPVENHMNEIKISTPNKSFQVTERGQKFCDKYDELFNLFWFFSADLDIWNLDDPGDLLVASDFHRYVIEDIIKNKGNNNLEDVIKKSDNYGHEPEDIKEHLRSFLSLGLITPFNL